MADYLRKYATGSTTAAGADKVRRAHRKAGTATFSVGADWTPTAGDVKLSKDGAAEANITTLPAYSNGAWEYSFSTAELTCRILSVRVAATAVDNDLFTIETFASASGDYATDFTSQQPLVTDLLPLSKTATLADIVSTLVLNDERFASSGAAVPSSNISSLSGVSGLQALWAATNAVTLGGTNGNQITQTNDSVGSFHMTAAANAGPLLPGIYQRPVIAFDNNAQQILTNASISTASQNFAVFAVIDFSALNQSNAGEGFSTIFEFGSALSGLIIDYTDGKGHLSWTGQFGITATMTARLPSGRCILGAVGTAASFKLIVNGTVETFAALSSITWTGMTWGKWDTVSAAFRLNGNLVIAAKYAASLTAQNITDIVNRLMADRDVQPVPKARLIVKGDSYTRGTGCVDNLNVIRQLRLPSTIDQYTFAQPGQSVSTMNGEVAGQVDGLIGVINPTAFFTPGVGSNDIDGGASGATAYSRVQTLHSGRKSAGAQFCIFTTIIQRHYVSVSDVAGNAVAAAFNALARADYNVPTGYGPYVFAKASGSSASADYMIDLAAMPLFSATNAFANLDNYAGDQIHWTIIGAGAAAAVARPLLYGLLVTPLVTANITKAAGFNVTATAAVNADQIATIATINTNAATLVSRVPQTIPFGGDGYVQTNVILVNGSGDAADGMSLLGSDYLNGTGTLTDGLAAATAGYVQGTAIKTQTDKLGFSGAGNVLADIQTAKGQLVTATGTVNLDTLQSNAASSGADLRGAGNIPFSVTWNNSTTGQPVQDGEVWVTTDAIGRTVYAGTLITNGQGQVTFLLNANTNYYLWAFKDGVAPIVSLLFTAQAN